RKDQKNSIRKGAQLVSISCWHPDVIEFIESKNTPGKLTKFNMSVMCTDKFMEAVQQDLEWDLIFPDYEQFPSEYKKEWNGDINQWKYG
ncbi:hypothetical protein, partial [Klebsiella pneumoniae]|uniref:hypothetical protein n=1 Tax=Klebsiella pneumoniae TaxID=573 RepID=UPI0025A1CAAF